MSPKTVLHIMFKKENSIWHGIVDVSLTL